MRRDWLLALGAVVVAALSVGALALSVEMWAVLYPDSPTLARAEAWRGVGEWVARVRRRHVRPPASRTTFAGPPAVAASPALAPAGERGPADLPAGVWPEVWLTPGERIRASPSASAPVVVEATAIANVRVLEASGDWRRVRWRGHQGWVLERPGARPPLGDAVEPIRPVEGRAPEPRLLATARALLSHAEGAKPGRLGPYLLLTDVEEPALLQLLDRAAAGLEGTYRSRYALELVGSPAEAVVLFRTRASYDDYVTRTGGPQSDSGHVVGGVVALYRQGRLIEEVRGTLVHELTHLLARRALGPALPSWLDEGMANDLADSRFGEMGQLLPGTLTETTLRSGPFFETHGGAASRALLQRRLAEGRLLPLAELTALDYDTFHAAVPRGIYYAQSSFFIRCLLDGELAAPFRAFLRQTAAGKPPTPDALQAALATPWPTLDAALAACIKPPEPPPPPAPPAPAPP